MKQRPISPHLSIYKLQITSGTSILHRITGTLLYIGIIILSWCIFCNVYFPNIIFSLCDLFTTNAILATLFKLAMLTWIFSLYYHLFNGIRHLFWDAGKGFNINIATISGKIVILLSALFTIVSWASS